MKYIIGLIILLAIFFIIVMIIDVNRFVVVRYSIKSPKLQKGCRLVVLSDLHNKQFGDKNIKLYKAIEAEKPDGIFIAGDMITAKTGHDNSATMEFIGKLAKKYPLFYGQGNHEYRMELYPDVYGDMLDQYETGLEKHGVRIMKNNRKTFGDYGIEVFGLSIDRSFYKRLETSLMEEGYVGELLGSPSDDKFNIMLAHNPDYYPRYDAWGADLVLSGHIHGGLMCLPFLGGVISPTLELFPKYDGGVFKGENGSMILSRGLGTHTLPIRIFNPGELVVVDLLPE